MGGLRLISRRRAGLLLGGGLALGCATRRVRLGEPPGAPTADDYPKVLAHWTRKDSRVRRFHLEVSAIATYLSWPFRVAQIAHRAERERLTGPDLLALRTAERTAFDAAHEFFVAFHTREWAWNHLEREGASDAMWRVRLLDDGGVVAAPGAVDRLAGEEGRLSPLYPYLDPFHIGYRVAFPRARGGPQPIGPGVHRFVLRIGGPQGAIDLVWEVAS